MMTKKRFKYIMFDGFEDNGKEMSPLEVEETLNKFQELSMEDYKKITRLENENKELKKENEQLKHDATVLICSNQKYRKENEQLKQEKFICLDCKYSGYTEIGCLCEKKDHWTDYKTECEDYEEFE
jgi:hypothetical protein